MKYFLPIVILFLSANLFAQNKEHHPIPTDTEVRAIFIEAVQFLKDTTIENNRIKAFKRFKEAAKLNDPTAQCLY